MHIHLYTCHPSSHTGVCIFTYLHFHSVVYNSTCTVTPHAVRYQGSTTFACFVVNDKVQWMVDMTVHVLLVFTNQCLLFFRSGGAPCDGCTVLLAHSPEISHGFHQNHTRKKLPPKGHKHGVAHRTHWLHTRWLLVEFPHLTFVSAAGCLNSCTQKHEQERPQHSFLLHVHVRCDLYISACAICFLPV